MSRSRIALSLLLLSACSTGRPVAPPAAAPVAAPPPVSVASETGAVVPIFESDPVWGERSAPVTIVEFSDLQCPFCARGNRTLGELETAYGPSVLRVVWKNAPLPFHEHAKPAAIAASGVFALLGPKAFFEFAERAFEHQRELGDDAFVKWATELGAPAHSFDKWATEPKWTEKVESDMALAEKLGVHGVPAYFINGTLVTGAQPIASFKTVIDAEIAKARTLASTGVPADRIYAARTKENFSAPPPEEPEPDESKAVYRIPLGKSPSRGGANPLVTIVEFSDFECPYCAAVEPTLQAIADKYGDKVRLVWRNRPLPFHPRAEPAAEFAIEARAQKGDKGFWAAHDALFSHRGDLEEASLLALAKDLGLNVPAVKASIQKHSHRDVLDEDDELATDFGVDGTPHFFINGRRLSGAQPLPAFTALIDEEIAHATTVLAGAAPTNALYDKLIEDGLAPPPPAHIELAATPNAPSKGDAKAKVTLSIFADFECPFAARAQETLRDVAKLYGSKVRFVWHNFPLPSHTHARLAAEAALEAYAQKGAPAFWKMHDTLFTHQQGEGLAREALDGYAKEQGLDLARWTKALDEHAHEGEVTADVTLGTSAGIEGTPTFVINGYVVEGAQPISRFRRLIDKALAENASLPQAPGHK